MNSPLSIDEIRDHLHPVLEGHRDWRPINFEATPVSLSVSTYEIVITIVRQNGDRKRLRFKNARLPDSCPGVRLNMWRTSMYVADISAAQWDDLTVEVGALDEEYPTTFFAASVEQIS
jgi:hypothetical protein